MFIDFGTDFGVIDAPSVAAPDFEELYRTHWWPLLRLAAGLVDDSGLAEDVVQEAFAALFRRWDALREPAAAVGYLRVCVVNGSRTVLRRRIRARKYLPLLQGESVAEADHTSLLDAERGRVRLALAALPDRQREVLTLRFITELSDGDIAAATGLSLGGVRSASSRGLAAMGKSLGAQQ